MKPVIMTSSGIEFDLLSPSASSFIVSDVVGAISRICRFGAQLSGPNVGEDDIYSVAQHSCYVHDLLAQFGRIRSKFWGLTHDCPEAFYGDKITPLKKHFPEHEALEDNAAATMRLAWGIPYNPRIAEAVHWADKVLGCAEAFVVKPRAQAQRMYGCEDPPITLFQIDPSFRCWTPSEARKQFMSRFYRTKQETIEQGNMQ